MKKELKEKLITDINILSERSSEVNPKAETFKEDMLKLRTELEQYIIDGKQAYITAKHIGNESRAFSIKMEDNLILFCIDPVIVAPEGLHASIEQDICLGIKKYLISRYDSFELNYLDIEGEPHAIKAEGHSAEIIQHCIELLDGILLSDLGLHLQKDYFEATEEEQKEVIKMYLEHLNESAETANNYVENNKELKERKEAIDYMNAVIDGKVSFYDPVKFLSNRKKKRLYKLAKQAKNFGKKFTKKKKKKK